MRCVRPHAPINTCVHMIHCLSWVLYRGHHRESCLDSMFVTPGRIALVICYDLLIHHTFNPASYWVPPSTYYKIFLDLTLATKGRLHLVARTLSFCSLFHETTWWYGFKKSYVWGWLASIHWVRASSVHAWTPSGSRDPMLGCPIKRQGVKGLKRPCVVACQSFRVV